MTHKLLIKTVLFITVVFCATPALAAEDCPKELEALPILAGGRVKPLEVHAKETIKFIYGKSKWEGQSAMELYCRLSLSSLDPAQQKAPALPIRVDHIKTQALLKIDSNQITYTDITAKIPELEAQLSILKTEKKDKSPFAKDIGAVIQKTRLYHDIINGNNWKAPFFHDGAQVSADKVIWIPLRELAALSKENQNGVAKMTPILLRMGADYAAKVDNAHLTELTYERLRLFHWAILAALLTLIVTAACRRINHPAVITGLAITFIIEIVAIVYRVMISQRAPVTNMYETVMWVGVGGLLIATILAYWRREKIFVLVGLGLNLSCLFMMTFAHGMLDPKIKPLVPVLRDNFWLSTHVTTITISYAVFALSWFMANYYLIRSSFGDVPQVFTRRISNLCYVCLKVGVILLAAGIILGGIWADYSWGRFWGWDPKETWSLIALLMYVAILHGRFSGWIPFRRFIPLVALSFLGILMAWFGVNYILAAGLHSYGFSEGGTIFLGTIFGIQMLILAVHLARNRMQPA